MASEIKMPQLGLTMTEGTVTSWFKKVGDAVSVGELLFEVATDKITNQIEATATGTLLEIRVAEGEVAPVQAVVGLIGKPGDLELKTSATTAIAEGAATTAASATASVEKKPAASTVTAEIGADGWVKASPAARKLAQEMNIDLAKVTATGPEGRIVEADVLGFGWVKASPAARKAAKDRGIKMEDVIPTGPDGRVVERDVLAFADNLPATAKTSPLAEKLAIDLGVDLSSIQKEARIMKDDVLAAANQPLAQAAVATAAVPVKPMPAKTKPLVGMRKVIADRMGQSWNTAPHVHLTVEIDMTNAIALKDQLAKASGQKASVTEIIIKCAAQVLSEFPVVNASIIGNQIVYHDSAAVGVAVSLDDGLIVPVIREVEKKSLREIRAAVVDLGARARAGKLLPDEISGGTFTVTNLGMFGTDHFTPIINPPESAILAVCRTVEKPVVQNGQIVVRPMCNCVLGFDHRLVDGAVGAKYMARFRELMENPLLLLVG
jgi:pyruvate dehydrogenase E2 component (dihydrolipoamide acetyltransferase)